MEMLLAQPIRRITLISSHTLVTLGTVTSALGDSEQAVGLLERAIVFQPRSAVLHYHIAHAYAATDRPVAALESMRAARDLDPAEPRYAEWLEAHPAGGS